jgi:hypothetical protein
LIVEINCANLPKLFSGEKKTFYKCGNIEINILGMRKIFSSDIIPADTSSSKTKAPNTRPGALASLFPFAGINQIKL